MEDIDHSLEPSPLLKQYADLFSRLPQSGPILDVACGVGHNGIFLARRGLSVVCCDRSEESLEAARSLATKFGVSITTWHVDLEMPGRNPLPRDHYGGFIVFRYLHRPLIPCIKKAMRENSILIYETYTEEQPRFGKPHNPDFLLKPSELRDWFKDWQVIHYYEGLAEAPKRAVAQLVCRKPPGIDPRSHNLSLPSCRRA
jgi:tellurite methyltransferase